MQKELGLYYTKEAKNQNGRVKKVTFVPVSLKLYLTSSYSFAKIVKYRFY